MRDGSFPPIEKASAGELVGAVLLKPLPRSEDWDASWRSRDDPSAIPPVHEIENRLGTLTRPIGKGLGRIGVGAKRMGTDLESPV